MHKFNRGVRRRLSILLLFIMIFMQPVYAMTPKLSETHWAYGTMMELVRAKVFSPMSTEWGLDEPITRQEFVRLINKAYGNKILGNVSFTDVSEDSLYYKDVAKAVASGMISGYPDGTFKPEATITRQEAAAVLATMSRKENVMTGVVSAFSDGSQIPDWSKENMAWMIQKSFMNGYPDGTIGYAKTITYAEALAVTKNILGSQIVTESIDGNGQTITGNVSIIEPDVKLSNMVITGDLMIGGQVGNGDVTLDNVEIEGRLLVYGGGQNSIHLFNSIVSQLIVSRFEAPVRIVSDSNSQVRDSVIETSSVLEAPPSANVFKSVIVQPKIVNMAIDLKGTFENIAVNNIQQQLASAGVEAELPVKINIPLGSIIKTLRVATKAEIAGSGEVQNADVQVNDVKVNVKTNSFTLGNGVTKVVVNNKSVSTVREANSAGSTTNGTTSGTTNSTSSGGSSGGSSSNDDNTVSPSTIQFDATTIAQSANEGDSTANSLTFTLVRTGNTAAAATVIFSVAGSGTNSAATTDYSVQTTSPITFFGGESSKTIVVNTVPDTTVESDETFTVTLTSAGGNGQLGTEKTATGTITNDDTASVAPSTIQFASTSLAQSANEGDTAGNILTFTVERTGNTAAAATVDFMLSSSGTSPADTMDYMAMTISPLSFAAGETSKSIYVNTLPDTDVENDETFTITLTGVGGNGQLGTSNLSAIGTILNDDTVPTTTPSVIQFSSSTLTVSASEGNTTGAALSFTVERTGNTAETATVAFAVTGTGTNPASTSDYSVQTTSPISFAASETSKTITVNTVPDTDVESDETFTVTLANPGGNGQLGTSNLSATGTITNDDSAPQTTAGAIQFASTTYMGSEGGTDPIFTLSRTGGDDGTVTVDIIATPGTASTLDYGSLSTSTVTFTDGVISQTVTLPIVNDTLAEASGEQLTVSISNPTGGATLGTTTSVPVTIYDNDQFIIDSVTSSGAITMVVAFNEDLASLPTTSDGSITVTSGASLVTSGTSITVTDIQYYGLSSSTIELTLSENPYDGVEITFNYMLESVNGGVLSQQVWQFSSAGWTKQ